MNRYDKLRVNTGTGLVLVGLSLFLLFVTTTFSKGQGHDIAEPAFWPRIVLLLLLLLSLVMALQGWLGLRKSDVPSRGADARAAAAEGNNRKLLIGLLSSAAYLIALGPVGFLVSTPFYIASLVGILEERRLARVVTVALLADALFFLLFVKVVSYELPRGAWLFRDLSLLLY